MIWLCYLLMRYSSSFTDWRPMRRLVDLTSKLSMWDADLSNSLEYDLKYLSILSSSFFLCFSSTSFCILSYYFLSYICSTSSLASWHSPSLFITDCCSSSISLYRAFMLFSHSSTLRWLILLASASYLNCLILTSRIL